MFALPWDDSTPVYIEEETSAEIKARELSGQPPGFKVTLLKCSWCGSDDVIRPKDSTVRKVIVWFLNHGNCEKNYGKR